MQRRGSHPTFYGYGSPNSHAHGSSGEEGFRSPRPQYQSSPRVHHPHFGGPQQLTPSHSPAHRGYDRGYHHPSISPISHLPTDTPRGRHPSVTSPGRLPSPNYRGGRGGGRPRFHSGGHSPRTSRDSNPGGSDDISQYFHPSMLEDPWERLQTERRGPPTPAT